MRGAASQSVAVDAALKLFLDECDDFMSAELCGAVQFLYSCGSSSGGEDGGDDNGGNSVGASDAFL